MNKISTRFIAAMVSLAILVVLIMGGASYINVRKMLMENAKENLTGIVKENASEIEKSITEMLTLSNQLENIVVKNMPLEEVKRSDEAMERFKRDIQDTFVGVLETFDAQSGWFIFDDATIPDAGTLSFTKQENGYNREADYNVREEGYDQDAWFQGAIDNEFNWTEPYFWEPWNAEIISYSQGVKIGNEVIGVAGTDFFYDQLKTRLSEIVIYESGYVSLLSSDFNIIYHPTLQGENLKTVSDGAIAFLADEMRNGEATGIIPYKFDGEEKLMAYTKLSNGWYLTANPVVSEIYKDLNKLALLFVVIGAIGITLSIILAVFISNRLSQSVSSFKTAFETGASGDLSVRVAIKTKDEFAVMGDELNGFMGRIHQVISDIKHVITSAGSENEKIVQSMDNIIKGSESDHHKKVSEPIDVGVLKMSDNLIRALDNVKNQAAGTEESLAGLEEILASSKLVAENTEKALSFSKQTTQAANESERDVYKMNENMHLVEENLEKANEQIKKLSVLSSDIGGILLTINEISEKTNLLALNAAIEAARAGEAGRGFAVVADEIRKLAEQTSSETDKITSIVESIQAEVVDVQKANVLVTENVQTGLNAANKVSEKINDILGQAKLTFEVVEALEVTGREQMVATEEITKAVGDIAQSSVDIEQSVYETHESFDKILSALNSSQEAIEALDEQMKQIEEEIEFFKL